MLTKHPALVNLWARHSKFVEFSDSPWALMSKATHQCRLALVTTGGVHLLSQPPFNMKVLRLLLKYLEELDSPGSIVKHDLTYSDDSAAESSKYVNS